MTEAEFQQQVTDLCDLLGLMWHHETDSRKSKKGFPDLVVCGPGGVVFLELKTDRGRVSAAQDEWLDRLTEAGAEAYVVRPRHFESLRRLLVATSRRTAVEA